MSGRLRDAAADGVAVLLISTELEEVLDLSDRIVVMSHGRVVGEMPRGDVDLDRLGMLMGGRDRMSDRAGRAHRSPNHESEEDLYEARAPVAALRATARGRRALRHLPRRARCALAALLVVATGGSWTGVYQAMLDGSDLRRRAGWGLTLGRVGTDPARRPGHDRQRPGRPRQHRPGGPARDGRRASPRYVGPQARRARPAGARP